MVTSGRWVCRRCFTDNEGTATECASCALGRWAELPEAGAVAAPSAEGTGAAPDGATTGEATPAWQPPAPPAAPFWKKLLPYWWVGLVGVFIVAGLIFNAKRDDTGAITDAGTLHVSDLRVGDCFNASTEGEIDDVDAVPCTAAHAYELFHVFTMTDPGQYPTDADFEAQTDAACSPAFTAYVGVAYEASTLFASSLEPTEAAWNDGDHTVQCMLHEEDESQVTGSQRGSAR